MLLRHDSSLIAIGTGRGEGELANPIIFRRNINIGAPDAESDSRFLANCFIDTGDLAALLDCANPKSIVLGRTGSGKTALLQEVKKKAHNAIELSPEALSLHYISNSSVLKFFENSGVHLDIFYTLLWRHILTVELLRKKFEILNEGKQGEFLALIANIFSRDKSKEKALKYLEQWGSKFWQETEYRTKEFTTKLEADLRATAKIDSTYINLGAEGARKLTEEQKLDVIHHAQNIVNSVQIKELHDVIKLLSEDIFNDPYQKYYILIDKLDEGWVPDGIRFKLIKALFEAIRTFRQIHSVKVIVALRSDLHHRVLAEAASPSFQEEKLHAFYLKLRWSREQLVRLLNERVNYMFRFQYTRTDVLMSDILPSNQIEKRDSLDYILDRTFFRPREAIIFLNECIEKAEGASRINIQALRQAEIVYSKQRLQSLFAEWRREYPALNKTIKFLDKARKKFLISDFDDDHCRNFALAFLEDDTAIIYFAPRSLDIAPQVFLSASGCGVGGGGGEGGGSVVTDACLGSPPPGLAWAARAS